MVIQTLFVMHLGPLHIVAECRELEARLIQNFNVREDLSPHKLSHIL